MHTLLTNEEFQRLYKEKLNEHPILKLSEHLTLNEAVWLLRQMNTDFLLNYISDSSFCFIPSVKETLIPTKDLAKKVKSIECHDSEDSEYPSLDIKFYKGR